MNDSEDLQETVDSLRGQVMALRTAVKLLIELAPEEVRLKLARGAVVGLDMLLNSTTPDKTLQAAEFLLLYLAGVDRPPPAPPPDGP